MTMTRDEAVRVAKDSAVEASKLEGAASYLQLAEHQDWQPHEWVVNAVQAAGNRPGAISQMVAGAVSTLRSQGFVFDEDEQRWFKQKVAENLPGVDFVETQDRRDAAERTLTNLGYVYVGDTKSWCRPDQPVGGKGQEPGKAMEREAGRDAAVRTLTNLRYRWCGGSEWAPPLGEAPSWLNIADPEKHDAQDESYLATNSSEDGDPIVGEERLPMLLARLEETVRVKTMLEEQYQGKSWPERAAYWHGFYRDTKLPKLRATIFREAAGKLDPALVKLIRGDLKNTIDSNLNTTQTLDNQLANLRKTVNEKQTFHDKLSREIELAQEWLAAHPDPAPQPAAESEDDPWP